MNSFGSLVTNLFAIAFGLGSLKLAVEGLWRGAIGGLSTSGADIAFSAHPLGFVFLVVAWTGFGIFLVWFGWRGFTRPDVVDAGDDERGDSAPLPQARSQPVPGRHSDLRAAPQPALPHLQAALPAVVAARPAVKTPDSLVLYKSRAWAVFVLVVATLVILGAGYACAALSYYLTPNGAALLFSPALVGYLVIAWKCMRDFFWQGPALVLDRFGILDYRRGERSIPWTDVDAVRLHANSSTTFLVLRFRHLERARTHFGPVGMLGALMGRIFYKGFEGRVMLTSLAFRRAQVLQTAQVFVRHARREAGG